MHNPTLAVVIVNWNTGGLLRDCLASLEGSFQAFGPIGRLTQVVVIDNASSDDSANDLFLIGRELIVIKNQENRGFAVACNQGAALCSSDYILFLNPDTRLKAESLSVPVAWLQDAVQKRVGIVGVQLLDDSGEVSSTISHFPQPFRYLAQSIGLDRVIPGLAHALPPDAHQREQSVDQVMGAFFLVRRSLFDSLGGFDERFFVYFEEVDFCYRARLSGWATCYLPQARAYHKGCGSSSQVKAQRLYYSLRSRLLYAQKHFSAAQCFVAAVVTLGIEPVSRAGQLLLFGKLRELPELARAYAWLFAFVRGQRYFFRKRH